jgi:hypothetical protein
MDFHFNLDFQIVFLKKNIFIKKNYYYLIN